MVRAMKALLFSLFASLAACGGQIAQPIDGGPSKDASTQDVGATTDANPPPPGDSTVGCNDVSALATTITTQLVAQDAPPSSTVSPPPPPGTYALESATLYTGKNGSSGPGSALAVTLRIESDGTTWKVVTASGTQTDRRNFAITKQALGLALATTCGGTDSTPVEFVAISSPGFVMQTRGPQVGVYLFRPFMK